MIDQSHVGKTVYVDGKQKATLVLLDDGYAVVELGNGVEFDYPASRIHARSHAEIAHEQREAAQAKQFAVLSPDQVVSLITRHMLICAAVRLTGGHAAPWEQLSVEQKLNFARLGGLL